MGETEAEVGKPAAYAPLNCTWCCNTLYNVCMCVGVYVCSGNYHQTGHTKQPTKRDSDTLLPCHAAAWHLPQRACYNTVCCCLYETAASCHVLFLTYIRTYQFIGHCAYLKFYRICRTGGTQICSLTRLLTSKRSLLNSIVSMVAWVRQQPKFCFISYYFNFNRKR